MAKLKAESRAPIVEEIHFRSDNAFLCLLLNRRTRFIRIIDFRAGALPAKRLFIQSVAKREGIAKVLTLVEKDEVSSWTRVGFVREGTIPGFYKRSDGHLCGCVIGEKTASVEIGDDGMKVAERTINAAKKGGKTAIDEAKNIEIVEIDSDTALGLRDETWKKREGLNSLDPFGRDAERMYVQISSKKVAPNVLAAEYQDCFGHSLVEILRSPKTPAELGAVTAGLLSVSETLKARGIVSAFGFAPSDDAQIATAYLAAGFRRTGLLAQGMLSGDKRKDAILWTRKLASPGGEDEPI